MNIYQYKVKDCYSGRCVIIETTKERGEVIKDFIEKVMNVNDELFGDTPELEFKQLSNEEIIRI